MARILIVGAGPAGMTTALFLARLGIRSVLIDKERFPRDKICGDGLSGWVLYMLDRLNPEWTRELASMDGAQPSGAIRFYAPNLKQITLPYRNKYHPGLAPGYIIRRREFDAFLWQKVEQNPDIETIEGLEITDFYEDNGEAVLSGIHTDSGTFAASATVNPATSELRGDLVVFADGAGARFTRHPSSGLKNDRHHATGIKLYFKGLPPADENLNPVEFYFLKSILPGYLWIFPLPGGEANVGMGIRTDVMKRNKIQLKRELLRSIEETPILKERFQHAEAISEVQAWGLPLGSKKMPISGNRYLLTGDAASLIDPFTGEGVGNAMNSGFHAAEHIEKCILNNRYDADFNRQYDQRVYAKLWKELRNSKMIQDLLVRPQLFSWVMNRAVTSPYLQKSFVRMIDSLDERKKLANPLFYLRVLLGR